MRSAALVIIGGGLAAALLLAVLFIRGPFSLNAAFRRDTSHKSASSGPTVTQADLRRLPPPVQRYLHLTGFVGARGPSSVRARLHGRIRSSLSARWMKFSAEQRNTFEPKSRHFYLDAFMFGLPVQGYHSYVAADASMDIRLLGVLTVQKGSGADLTRAETVTLFNDMCVLAPGSLVDPAIVWTPVDEQTAHASFTNAGHTIGAELAFNEAGELIDFRSDDRLRAMPDGTMRRTRWSTPIRGYRSFGRYYLASEGEARWHDEEGSFAYIQLTFDDVVYDT